MSNPPDNLRLRALLEQAVATGNAAIVERDRLKAINAELLEALQAIVANANGDSDTGYFDVPVTSIHAAESVIAKSTGEIT